MWSTSAAFDEALTRSRRIATKVEILQGGKTQAVLDVITDGKVTADNSAVRRSGNVTAVDPTGTLTPVTAKDLLAPRGTEFRMFKGLNLAAYGQPDNIEWVPLATLRIAEPRMTHSDSGLVISMKGYDRAKAIQQRRFAAPYVITEGAVATTVIADIISSRSTFPINVTPSTRTIAASVFEALSDPMAAITQIAAAISYEVFFDVLGTFTARPVPDYLAQSPVWAYAPGELSLMLGTDRSMTDEDSYSGVVVTNENSNPDVAPIRVALWDTDPTSPTYYDPAVPAASTFGPVPYGFASPLMTTSAMALLAAQTIGARVFGLQEQTKVSCMGHWGHDLGDVVTVDDPTARLNGSHIIEKVDQPLRGGPMELQMRKRRVPNT